jgi:hypothetical protein
LLDAFGSVCAFTGPAPAPALEACHLYSYSAVGEHHTHGGLLLRRDVHRLFDLGYLAVNPYTLAIDVADALRTFPIYTSLDGQGLHAVLGADLDRAVGLSPEEGAATGSHPAR